MIKDIFESAVVHFYNFILTQGIKLLPKFKSSPKDNALFLGYGSPVLFPTRQQPVALSTQERLRHCYVIGSTGAGKSKFLEGLIRQDVLKGNGFGVIDPHGDLVESILGFITDILHDRGMNNRNQEILSRLILVDLSDEDYAIGFNPLETIDKTNTYQLILELVEVFKKIWEESWGPRMEELLRCGFYALAENNLTLLEMPRLLTDLPFRTALAEKLTNQEIKDYWLNRFNNLSDKMQIQYFEPVANKLSAFIADPFLRSMLAQEKSSFNFRKIMDEGKILLINLSKGKFKENAFLVGALFLAKIQMAALSRQEMPLHTRRPWHLYIDEFQNFATDTFEVMLSEARKYGLGLVMAHQNLAALKRKLRESILGNAYTQIYFRVSRADANELSGEMSVENKQLLVRDLIDLKTSEAFVKIKTQPPLKLKTAHIDPPTAKTGEIKALRKTILQANCKKRMEIEKELQTRKARIDKMLKDFKKGGWEDASEAKPQRKTKPTPQELQEIE